MSVDDAVEYRKESTESDEALLSEQRTIIRRGSSLYLNLTDFATRMNDWEEGDKMTVDIHDGEIRARRAEE